MKTLLITGSTDGIGALTAERLVAAGHRVVLHGRSADKLEAVRRRLAEVPNGGPVEGMVCDLSNLAEVRSFADTVVERYPDLDVLVNNAGVYTTRGGRTPEGLYLQFAVNTVAPYLLTERLLPVLGSSGRVVNLSSAAQARVQLDALEGMRRLSDSAAYAQSKLAITAWSHYMARTLGANGPAVIAVNPGSMLASKMVSEAYGVRGRDLGIGADILVRASLSDAFAQASGRYFDNDSGRFAAPHPDANDPERVADIVGTIQQILASTP